MNAAGRILLFILMILTFGPAAFSQSATIKKANFICIDTLEQAIRVSWCNGNMPLDGNPEKEYKKLLPVITVLNTIFRDSFALSDLDAALRKIKVDKIFRKESDNGEIKVLDLRIPIEGFYVNIRLESIGGLITRKKYTIDATKYLPCFNGKQRLLNFPMVKYLVADHAEFPITILDLREVIADTLVYKNIDGVREKIPGYKLLLAIAGEPQWVDKLLKKQLNSDSAIYYNPFKPDRYMTPLILSGKYEILSGLLFSPNYFFAVGAMEALIYLDAMHKRQLSDTERQRIADIKNGTGTLNVSAGSDISQLMHGYKELGMSDEKVIKKYSSLHLERDLQ